MPVLQEEAEPDLGLSAVQKLTEAAVHYAQELGDAFLVGVESSLEYFNPANDESAMITEPFVQATSKYKPEMSEEISSLVLDACIYSRGIQLRPSEALVSSLAKKLRHFSPTALQTAFQTALDQSGNLSDVQRTVFLIDALKKKNLEIPTENFFFTFTDKRVAEILSQWGHTATQQEQPALL